MAHLSSSSCAAPQRLRSFWGLQWPNVWEVKTELGNILLEAGVAEEALGRFRELNQWERMTFALCALGRKEEAEALLRERLAEAPSALVLCYLGDLKEQPDFAARSFSAGELFDDAVALVPDESDYGDSVGEDAIERSIGAILVGLEEYFVDYGFFIGWDQGENIGSGLVFPHLAFREGAVEM